eukprot:gene3470-2563_t
MFKPNSSMVGCMVYRQVMLSPTVPRTLEEFFLSNTMDILIPEE